VSSKDRRARVRVVNLTTLVADLASAISLSLGRLRRIRKETDVEFEILT